MSARHEVLVNEVTIPAKLPSATLVRMIQRGELRGRYDASRPTAAGRWFVNADDAERLVKARATVEQDAA